MTVSYENYLGEPITFQQVDLLDDYNKNYYDDDSLIRKVEHYEKKIISSYTYYLSSNEALSVVLDEFKNESVDIITRSYFGSYRIEESKDYTKNTLKFYFRKLYDSNNNLICEQEFSINDLTVLPAKTEKYLYVVGEELCALGFEYNEDGLVNYIWGQWVENTDKRWTGGIYSAEIFKYFPTLFTDHPYYANFEFLPGKSV